MSCRMLTIVLGASALLCLAPAAGRAQLDFHGESPAMKDTVSAVGVARVQRPPTALRMHVQVTAKGKTLEEALAKLKDRKEALAKQLEVLKAEKEAVKFGPPNLSNPQNAQQRRFEAMVVERMGRGKKAAKGKPAKPPITVTSMLTAQWPLAGDSPEQILLAAQSLQEKVKAADLGGSKEVEKLSLEEQEVAEESAAELAEMMRNSGEEPVLPGQATFLYVAKISPQDRDKGMAEAFGKAKRQAGELARAAGADLGALTGLAGRSGGRAALDDEYGGRSNYMMRQMMMQQMGTDGEGAQDEALGSNPGPLSFEFYVMATFRLGK